MNKSDLFLHIIPRKEAKRLGLKRYFTGKPCKHGHIDERFADGTCRQCMLIKLRSRPKCHTNKRPFIYKKPVIHGPQVDLNTARDMGLKTYFTYGLCKNGHAEPSLTSKQICVACKVASDKEYRKTNKSRIAKQQAGRYNQQKLTGTRWYDRLDDNQKSDLNQKKSAYIKDNRPQREITNRRYYIANKAAYQERKSKYRASLLLAVPSFFDRRKCHQIYKDSKVCDMHVDHIVPLQSDFVCGLHWHGNMQLLSPSENQSKGNRYWPDMPDTSDPDLLEMVRGFNANKL